MYNKLSILLIVSVCFSRAEAQSNGDSIVVNFEAYTGFYNVGTKPGKSRFIARVHIEQGKLMFSAPGGSDSEIKGYVGNHRFEGENKYVVQFEVKNETTVGFILYRPREDWPTDLFGMRNTGLDQYSNSKSLVLDKDLATEHFKLQYTDQDSINVKSIAENLEGNYQRIVSKFGVSDMPIVSVKIYPDFQSYRLAVLNPNAPDWQKGQAWSKEDIRMVSPEVVAEQEREFVLTNAAVHEFVHCLHMYLANRVVAPRWLWEGVAMYAGCCMFFEADELPYLKKGKHPSLNQVNKDPEQAYQLGYYIVEYIDTKFDWSKVLELIKNGGNIKSTLQMNRAKFEEQFYQFIEQKYLNN